MVANTVNVPQGLPASALTTTSASTASRMIMITSTPISAIDAGSLAHLHPDHLAERAAVAARRDEQDDEVLHAAGEHRRRPASTACRAGSPSARRARARPADRRRRWPRSGGRTARTCRSARSRGRRCSGRPASGGAGSTRSTRLGDEQAVEAVGDQIDADRRDHEPDGVHRLAAVQRHGAEATAPITASTSQPSFSTVLDMVRSPDRADVRFPTRTSCWLVRVRPRAERGKGRSRAKADYSQES